MNTFFKCSLAHVLVLLTLALHASADVAAPTALPPCIIQYSSGVFNGFLTRVVVYKADSTFIELSNTSYSYVVAVGTNPYSSSAAYSGTYVYAVDPNNPAHATIQYGNVNGALANDDLYFEMPNRGRLTVSQTASLEGGSDFTVYPLHENDSGSIAFSTRCNLAAGGTVTSGLAIASGGPRWVLIRAVGASLATYGVGPTVSQPSFTLYNSGQGVVGRSSVWASDPNLVNGYKTVFSMVGEFPLKDGSDEGVLLVLLQPGTYTAEFSATSAGQILCEAYVLPY